MIIADYRFLSGAEAMEAMGFIEQAAEVAREQALCQRSKCGSKVVKDGNVIGSGFNTPPQYDTRFATCSATYDTPKGFIYDRTCCIHAEQIAMDDAKEKHPDLVVGARLYYAGIDKSGKLKHSRKPKCTICSRLALHYGLAEFVLYHAEGICVYSTEYYDKLSFQFTNQ